MNLGDRLLSRKFWLALTAVIGLFAVRAYGEVAQVVIAYLAVQAGVDAFSTYTASRTTAPEPVSPAVHDDGDDEEVSGWTGSVI